MARGVYKLTRACNFRTVTESRGRKLTYLAGALFALGWLFLSQTLPVWIEEVAVYPAPATPNLVPPLAQDPRPRFEPNCSEPGPIRLMHSDIRPKVAVCFGDRQYPLMVMSYASGIPYWISDLFWPIHQGQIFWLRAFGLFLGLLNIALARRLLMRLADSTTANVAALCLAVTPPFLVVQSMSVHFEVIPWLACAVALDQLLRCRSLSPNAPIDVEPPPTGRLLAAAALIGLALIANIKAVFLIAPLCLIALRARVRFSALRLQQWLLVVAVLATVVSLNLVGNAVDAGAGFSSQIQERWEILVEQLHPQYLFAEIYNLTRFWGDTLVFMAIASGDDRPPFIPGRLAVIPPLLYCALSGVVYLWRGRGALVPAACGLLLLTFMVVSALLYIDIPKGNYGPLYAVLGIATAATAVDGSRWLALRFNWSSAKTTTAIVVLTVLALIWSLVGRGSPTHYTTMSINGAAVRQLGAYLAEHAEPGTPLFVTTYNLTGVPEAVSGEAVRTIKASNYLDCPPGINRVSEIDAETLEQGRRCLQLRFERLLEVFPEPARFLLPLKTGPVDHALDSELGATLEAAAAAAGRPFREEVTFSGWDTGPLSRLVRVESRLGGSTAEER